MFDPGLVTPVALDRQRVEAGEIVELAVDAALVPLGTGQAILHSGDPHRHLDRERLARTGRPSAAARAPPEDGIARAERLARSAAERRRDEAAALEASDPLGLAISPFRYGP